jgi:hypothetical protein
LNINLKIKIIMSEVITTTNGREILTGKPGDFVSHNPENQDGHTPGESLVIKNGKLFSTVENQLNPYRGSCKVIERIRDFVFVSINAHDWYTFRVKQDSEGADFFSTHRRHDIGINDNYDTAYSQFQQICKDDELKNEVTRLKREALQQLAAGADKRSRKVAKIKDLRSQALIELKTILKDIEDLDSILLNVEVSEIIDRYNKYNLILKAL